MDGTGEVRVVVVSNSKVPHLFTSARQTLSKQSEEWQSTLAARKIRGHPGSESLLPQYPFRLCQPKPCNRPRACKTMQLCHPHEPSFICPAARTKPDWARGSRMPSLSFPIDSQALTTGTYRGILEDAWVHCAGYTRTKRPLFRAR